MVRRFGELGDGKFLFRSMKLDGSYPSVGPTTRQLGLRTHAGDLPDITIDDDGNVQSDEEGLSMSTILEAYDRALHDTPVRSVQMAQRLLSAVKHDIESGSLSREEAYRQLVELYDRYEERGQTEELEAVADVLDSFDHWSPLKTAM
jgi:hypothetical protein